MTMRRLDWMARACAALVVMLGGVAPVAAAEGRQGETPAARAAQRPAPAHVVAALSRLHHVAKREMELGMLAQVAAVRPETMAFATELETSFRALDKRVVALAATFGIAESRLRLAYASDNTDALHRQTQALERLSVARGQDFDRQFWVSTAQVHQAASDVLAPAFGAVGADRRIDALVVAMVLLIDQSSRKAIAAGAAMNQP
jgi:hypothetical protein